LKAIAIGGHASIIASRAASRRARRGAGLLVLREWYRRAR
jgi:hypothetical protein